MRRLVDAYQDDPRTTQLLQALRASHALVIGAAHGCLPQVLIAAAWQALASEPEARPALLVHGDPETCVDDLEELGVPAAVLPELDSHESEDPDELDQGDPALHRRADAMQRLARGAILVATPRACEQPVPRIHDLGREAIAIKPGDWHEIHSLAERLADAGYTVTTVAERHGQIAVRGGILDVYPFIGKHGIRIEFFGDEVDTLRSFDPFTQESIGRLEGAELVTATGAAHCASLWSELPERPILHCADVPLSDQLSKSRPPLPEIRLARQLGDGAVDGAAVTVERYAGDLLNDCRELQQLTAETEVIVFARNEEAQQQLGEQFAAHQLGRFAVRIGRLSAGWRDLERDLLVVHDFELTRRKPVTRRKVSRVAGGAPLSGLSDLKHGDYVVHIKHGIAKFRGMATLEKRGWLEDHLLLEFAEESRLYVPVSSIDLIQKYIGGGGRHPELSRIGGAAWARKRQKAEKAVEDLTAELLDAQATRMAQGGLSITTDEAAYARFCAAFPYEETEDQLSAAREIRESMALPMPMDRLLCGDVGFGKTEVAMRAAFIAAAAGLQVALLAPTTLLTEQHAESFIERFKDTPYTVACMNRYRSNSQRSAILRQVASGEIHILIGTHALLTNELSFAGLGLLIVDEEQRFGVKQKEFLKSLKAGVDCLTLSATPIPRTLHFGMLGLRDISVLAEAPAERLAVDTHVAIWDSALVRDAIRRERERGGQIFVVHNRVGDIEKLAFKLSRLVPEMRYAIIHGQMKEEETARVMRGYKHGEIDCLVATSIIESGIDIPNANTLIVNNAHFFGLAELHQIRGRIGRFTRQAYAYFITPPVQRLGAEAVQRLDAIQEYAELGAGFKLALRDLELRGAGNLLGAEQSGHIEAIGYELYCKLLAEAVERRRLSSGAALSPDAPRLLPALAGAATLAFPLDAYIPDDWLDAPSLKFELHKAIDAATRPTDLQRAAASAIDRYGALVDPVRRLFAAKAIRLAARKHEITRITWHDRQMRIEFTGDLPQLDASRCPELVHIQAADAAIVCFIKHTTEQDERLDFLARLFDLDLRYLARD